MSWQIFWFFFFFPCIPVFKKQNSYKNVYVEISYVKTTEASVSVQQKLATLTKARTSCPRTKHTKLEPTGLWGFFFGNVISFTSLPPALTCYQCLPIQISDFSRLLVVSLYQFCDFPPAKRTPTHTRGWHFECGDVWGDKISRWGGCINGFPRRPVCSSVNAPTGEV